MDSIAELRARVQLPVRKYNDVAGLLIGDRVSIHVTRLFVQLGWSPTIATVGMLVFGVVGSVLVAFGELWSVAGFACVFVYYIADCVDGEVARYHNREKLIFGFHDFMFHLYVKSSFFVCLGILAVRTTGAAWTFLVPLAALLAVLFQKFLHDLPLLLTARYVLLRRDHERRHFIAQIMDGAEPGELESDGALPDDHKPCAFRGPLAFLRVALTNFDLAVVVFLAAAIADLFVAPVDIAGLTIDLKVALVFFYGFVLPLDFVDQLVSFVRADQFVGESRRLLRSAHHFRVKD